MAPPRKRLRWSRRSRRDRQRLVELQRGELGDVGAGVLTDDLAVDLACTLGVAERVGVELREREPGLAGGSTVARAGRFEETLRERQLLGAGGGLGEQHQLAILDARRAPALARLVDPQRAAELLGL